jgi:hypothetical protein
LPFGRSSPLHGVVAPLGELSWLEHGMMLQRLVAHDAVPQRLVDYASHQWLRSSVQQWINHQRPPLTEY